MPAVRVGAHSRRGSYATGRRRSSGGTNLAKAGTYGYTAPPPISPPLTFAPNVTPTSYSAPSPTPSPPGSPSLNSDAPLPLFPPSATPAPPPTRKRAPPGKRRSQGYIPRPPNAFMLFRADFVRQKHVPGSIETNHGSLSKIIGNCWRSLPLAEKHIWEVKAKHAKAEHKQKYPDYKFRPVHNKRGGAAVAAPVAQPVSGSNTNASKGPLSPQEDERRCEQVAALLLQGKKGEELASAIRDLDSRRQVVEVASHSPSPVPYNDMNSKYPHPLHLDPMYYPQIPSSPPSSSLASSQSASGDGSPYMLPLPMPLEHSSRDQSWRHRRSSSVPLPNDYSYTLPPFMYPELDYSQQQQHQQPFTLPPPSSLTSPPVSISDFSQNQRMSFSWMSNMGAGTGSSFSYPRPSFSFGGRNSFSFAGAFAWNGHGPVGRRASSAMAFFSPSSSSFAHTGQQEYGHNGGHGQEMEEELPDANTSLFDANFLNSFGGPAPQAHAPSPTSGPGASTNEGVSPFDAPPTLCAPQPVHPITPLGVEFGVPSSVPSFEEQQPVDSTSPFSTSTNDNNDESAPLDHGVYPPFEFPGEEPLPSLGPLPLRSSLDMSPFQSEPSSFEPSSSNEFGMEMDSYGSPY